MSHSVAIVSHSDAAVSRVPNCEAASQGNPTQGMNLGCECGDYIKIFCKDYKNLLNNCIAPLAVFVWIFWTSWCSSVSFLEISLMLIMKSLHQLTCPMFADKNLHLWNFERKIQFLKQSAINFQYYTRSQVCFTLC